ncbi:sacsin-like isoform X3 [Mya arenaria]|uniref:sacsin-like isoform X3 n=1 Tax=Mya arenaria TaxID=6604 RepID=UPI0022DEECE2|nr:sacsin-like isoform X3 [Mya arenaria]
MAFVGGGAAVRRQPLFSAMKQPSLIKQLRGILAEYPDGGQILKELIQNAEDAGAREVKILFDAGSTSRDAVDQEPEFTKFFQTPALCVYNDAVFTDQDWEGIKMIYSSIKEEDKSKVGRFGLGFKSVFHITDYPCIISGDQMLLIDPQKPPERVNARFEIPGLHDPWEGLDMNDFYKGLGGHFGIDHSMINDGRYSGTLFWFPLRKRPSPLSENLYDERKILDLFDGLKSEAPSILIFLRSLESLSIYTATENDHSTKVLKSQKKKHLSLHVSIKNAKDHVRQSREKFYAKMETNRSDVASMTDYCIEITDKARVTDHHWVVLNYFAGNFASERFQTLIDDKDLSMSPCVSIAVSLDRINQPFEGHIYCFMPLPKEGSKLTGLSFHVNGFFALSQNRHHMKWVTDEQKMQKVFDKNVLWNQYMVNEALPKAFQVIYLSLVRRAKQNGNSITDVMNVYRLLPNVNNVLDKWRKFIYNALSLVKPEKILFCRDLNDWISLQKSVFASFDNLPRHLEHVRSSVKECLKCMGHYLVEVPHEIVSTFKLIFPRQVTDVTPMLLAGYMRQNIKYIELDDKTKFNILDYLVSDGDSTKLESLHLILLASREWAAFSQQGKPIYICNENIVSLFPWMANRFLAPDAHSTSTETFCVSETVRPEILTDYVQEVVVTDGMEMLESSDADNWETFLRSDYFIEGIIRLLRYQTKFETATIGLNGTDEISIIDLLSNLKIKQVNGLKTMLKYKGNIVQGTESMKTCFIRNTDIDLVANSEQGKVRYELYFQVASNSSSYTIQHKLFTEADGLIKLVDLCTLCKLSKFTSHCVRDLMALMDRPQMISLELDQRKVDAYNLPFGFLRSAFPSPGTYVEPRFFPFMVQGIMPFKRHEYMYAALEIDNEHVNDETDRDDDMEDEMFIYVHIVHEIRNPNEISQLSTRYVVNVGNRFENRVEVPIYRLYKFLPQQQDNGQDIVEYDSEPVGSLPFDDNCRRIRDILREAFKLPLKDRKAVIRRLIKKWYPDKNEGREEYCTRVFNYMKDVILRLERGENIEGEINAATGMSEPDMSDSCYRDTATTAYNLGARYARGFKENIDDYNRSNRQGNYAHRSSNTCARPSVGESKRWLRQAKRDFTSARTALECSEHSSKPCYNWICFICHQACEKSLKAAWFSKDANLCPRRSHSLATIADNLGHTLLEEEARRFEENLQIAGHSYFRLRYPDSVYGNDIPSDVFDKDDAEFAVEATERILDMVDDFVQ